MLVGEERTDPVFAGGPQSQELILTMKQDGPFKVETLWLSSQQLNTDNMLTFADVLFIHSSFFRNNFGCQTIAMSLPNQRNQVACRAVSFTN
jgi:hypothetical protein